MSPAKSKADGCFAYSTLAPMCETRPAASETVNMPVGLSALGTNVTVPSMQPWNGRAFVLAPAVALKVNSVRQSTSTKMTPAATLRLLKRSVMALTSFPPPQWAR